MDEELRRIEEEINRANEKRLRLLERKSRRLKEIKARRQKDREEWNKKLINGLHPVLSGLLGDGYWYRITQKQIYDILTGSEIMQELLKKAESEEDAISEKSMDMKTEESTSDNAADTNTGISDNNENEFE